MRSMEVDCMSGCGCCEGKAVLVVVVGWVGSYSWWKNEKEERSGD